MRAHMLFLAGVLLMVFLFSCGPKVEPADLVLHNGKIATVDPAKPEARAIAVRGDAIVAVGSEEEIKPYIGEHTVVADLHGNLAIPGFIESHGHFTNLGETKLALDLSRAANWEEIVAMVAEAAKKTKPGAYILGRGWHQSKWDKIPSPDVEGFPLHDALSKVSPDNPVLLTHASGHAVIANAKAMEAARITRSTPNPPGGDILHDSRGNPAGVFREAAGHLVEAGLEEALNKRTAAEVEADARRVERGYLLL
jgi:predicted amidohydrolase YtcJ